MEPILETKPKYECVFCKKERTDNALIFNEELGVTAHVACIEAKLSTDPEHPIASVMGKLIVRF